MGAFRNLGAVALLAAAVSSSDLSASRRFAGCSPPFQDSCVYYLGACDEWFPEQCLSLLDEGTSYGDAYRACHDMIGQPGCSDTYGDAVFDYGSGCWACTINN